MMKRLLVSCILLLMSVPLLATAQSSLFQESSATDVFKVRAVNFRPEFHYVAGALINFSTSDSGCATISPLSARTDSNGYATANITFKDCNKPSVTLTASRAGGGGGITRTILYSGYEEPEPPPPPETPTPPPKPTPPSKPKPPSRPSPEPERTETTPDPEPERATETVKQPEDKQPEEVIEPSVKEEPEPPHVPVATGFYEFAMDLNAGWNFVHIPLLDVKILTMSELRAALNPVKMFYHENGCWLQADDSLIGNYQGIVIYMEEPITLNLMGVPLETEFRLSIGMSFVGLPRQTSNIQRVSDFMAFYPGVKAILVEVDGDIHVVGRAGDTGDVAVTGGQAFGIISTRTYFTSFHGAPWGLEITE